jgi:hypothetical protein
MTLNINDDNITSTRTGHSARLLPGDMAQWEVSWLPGQSMDRNHALAAMALADLTKNDEQTGQRLSMTIIDRATVLLPDLDAHGITASPSAEPEPGKTGQPSDPEAGG